MWASIEGVGDFVGRDRVNNGVNDMDDLFGKLIKVEDRRIRIQTNSMKLVTILHKSHNLTLIIFSTTQLNAAISSSLPIFY